MILLLYMIYLSAPMALLLIGSFGNRWTNTLLPEGASLRWYVEVAGDPSFRRAFSTSLFVAASACAVSLVVTLPLAYALFHSKSGRIRSFMRVIPLMPIAAPPIVLGFGYILVFSSDQLPFLGQTWLLVLAHVVTVLPYMFQTLSGDMRHIGLDVLENAADSLGSGFRHKFFRVVVPTLRQSIVSGLITAAALSIGEFQLTNLVSGFLNRTYPVVLLQSFYNATGFACAATVILLVLSFISALLGAFAPLAAAPRTGEGAP